MLVFISEKIFVHICGDITFSSSFKFDADYIPTNKINETKEMLLKLRLSEALLSEFYQLIGVNCCSSIEYDSFVIAFKRAESSLISLDMNSETFKSSRAEFNRKRNSLLESLINSGIQNKCCVDGCNNRDLTIDHKIPIRRGGSSDISNLQIMCRYHNSKKGYRLIQNNNKRDQ